MKPLRGHDLAYCECGTVLGRKKQGWGPTLCPSCPARDGKTRKVDKPRKEE